MWVLSAVHEHDETEVNDVLRATYLGARPVLVFIMDAEHKELAHECERFARNTLTKYEQKGDERTVLFSTGPMGPGTADTAWRDAIAQLFDELERQTPLPEDVRRPMTVVIGSRIVSEQARVGGIVRGEPVTLGMEVDLPVLGRRARIVSLAQADGARLDRIDVGRWAEMTLEGVSGSEITREIVVTTPGAAKLVRSCTGRVCELNDEVVPQSVHVRGHSTATNAAIEWLDARFMIPRRAKLVFNGPTAWADDNYVVLHDPRAVIEKPDTLLWLATFDADEIEYA